MKPSPITTLRSDLYEEKGVSVHLKRDDLIGGHAQGNKMRKLKYLIQDAIAKKSDTLITFGGAFSNHLYATAWAAQQNDLKSVGYVRGEIDRENPTMIACEGWGMELRPLSRAEYLFKDSSEFLEKVKVKYPRGYVIPEGGLSDLAMQGMAECAKEIEQHGKYDFWVVPCATGATLCGLLQGAQTTQEFMAMSVLKGADIDGLAKEVKSHEERIEIIPAHLGGFGKFPSELIAHIKDFHHQHNIILDPVYTGKMMLQLDELIRDDYFLPRSRILALHTGGHQGSVGYNYRFGEVLPVG